MKYKLTEETKDFYGATLYRIEAVESFGNVKAGEKGGWIEKEEDEERNMYILTVYREGSVKRRMFRDEAEAIKRMRKQIQHPEVIEATVSDLDKLTIRTPCATFKVGRI